MSANRTDKKEINMLVAELVAYLDEPQQHTQSETEQMIERTVRTLEDCSYCIEKKKEVSVKAETNQNKIERTIKWLTE